jgi:predicted amidophosphoribosyltransferase
MVECKSCGHELDKDANFCSHCGLRTDKGVKNGVKTPIDGRANWEKEIKAALEVAAKSVEEGFRIARESIREVSEELSTEFSERREKWESRRESQRDEQIYCPKCGHRNNMDAVFCSKCGKKLLK